MQTSIISGPIFVDEALFGIGLSYGTTSGMSCNASFRKSPAYKKISEVSKKLSQMQGGHNKFLETIMLTLDINAPRYWWQEFDTYRVGVTKQSESTIHTITKKPFDYLDFEGGIINTQFISVLNGLREQYLDASNNQEIQDMLFVDIKNHLPESYLQRRIVSMNIKALQNMWYQRQNHKLRQWHEFFSEISIDLTMSPYCDLVGYYIFGQAWYGDEKG